MPCTHTKWSKIQFLFSLSQQDAGLRCYDVLSAAQRPCLFVLEFYSVFTCVACLHLVNGQCYGRGACHILSLVGMERGEALARNQPDIENVETKCISCLLTALVVTNY